MSLNPSPEPVWVVGSTTWDIVRGERVPGGTALYIARASESVGVRAHVLFAGGEDADLSALAPSTGHIRHRLEARTLTLRHEFPTGVREQWLVTPGARTLTPADVPAAWPEPATLLLAPLLPEEIDVVAFIDEYPTAEVALLAQGLQRAVLPDGRIAHRAQPSSVLLDAARPNVSVFLSAEEVALWPSGAVEHLAARAARAVVTQGPRGATVIDRHGRRDIPPAPATAIDPTGAGDVFATAFILAVRAGEEFAGMLAAACAAAAVAVHGPGVLPSLTEMAARSSLRPAPGARGPAVDGGSAA